MKKQTSASKKPKLIKASNITKPGETGHAGSTKFYKSLYIQTHKKSQMAKEWLNRASVHDPNIKEWMKKHRSPSCDKK